MKNLYIKSFAAIFGMSVLAGCGENTSMDSRSRPSIPRRKRSPTSSLKKTMA